LVCAFCVSYFVLFVFLRLPSSYLNLIGLYAAAFGRQPRRIKAVI
jgi:hypothetical protein